MTIEQLFEWIATKYGWISLIMVAIISVLVEAIKIPIKMLTSKIKNEKLRKLANKSIILLTFGLAFLIEYLGGLIAPAVTSFNPTMALVEGCLSNLVYALGEGIITTTKAKEIADKVAEVSDDGTITANEAADVAKTAVKTTDAVKTKAKTTDVDVISARKSFNKIIGKK